MHPRLIKLVGLAILAQMAVWGLVSSAAVAEQVSSLVPDNPNLRIVSDEDNDNLQNIRYHIARDFTEFKNTIEVQSFLEKVRLLVTKHPKNEAFTSGDKKELNKFLSQEIVAKLIRVDNEPFNELNTDDKLALAQRAVDEDELTRKLFGGPLRSLVEARRQQASRSENGHHKEAGFFSNLWCKTFGASCSNQ